MENAQSLKVTLDENCQASEQRVNFSKASIFCGSEQGNPLAIEMAQVFEMNLVRDLGEYLGLPSLWGRSKCEALGFLSSKISNKMLGWRSKLLNNVGKDVLIKAVISAIPTYAMSVFQFSKTWCNRINGLIARFRWGHRTRIRKLIARNGKR